MCRAAAELVQVQSQVLNAKGPRSPTALIGSTPSGLHGAELRRSMDRLLESERFPKGEPKCAPCKSSSASW